MVEKREGEWMVLENVSVRYVTQVITNELIANNY